VSLDGVYGCGIVGVGVGADVVGVGVGVCVVGDDVDVVGGVRLYRWYTSIRLLSADNDEAVGVVVGDIDILESAEAVVGDLVSLDVVVRVVGVSLDIRAVSCG
jgi:hypothetical protein